MLKHARLVAEILMVAGMIVILTAAVGFDQSHKLENATITVKEVINRVEADLKFGSIGARNITSLALDSQGNPWIAFSDEQDLKLAVWDGSAWQTQTVVTAGSDPLGQLVSLKLDSKDEPHVVYFEVTTTRPLNGRIKYAKGTRP